MTKICINENNFNRLLSLALKNCGNSDISKKRVENESIIQVKDGKCIPGYYKNEKNECTICPAGNYENKEVYNCYDGQNVMIIDGLDPTNFQDPNMLFPDREGIICHPGFDCRKGGENDPVHCGRGYYCPGAYYDDKTHSVIGSVDPIKCPDGMITYSDTSFSKNYCKFPPKD